MTDEINHKFGRSEGKTQHAEETAKETAKGAAKEAAKEAAKGAVKEAAKEVAKEAEFVWGSQVSRHQSLKLKLLRHDKKQQKSRRKNMYFVVKYDFYMKQFWCQAGLTKN